GAETLLLASNGRAGKQVPSPRLGASASLAGVAAVSANSAWAVGSGGSLSSPQTLILLWNGATWKRVPSPSPGGAVNPDLLGGVAAVSAGRAWTVGCTTCATASGFNMPLIEGWNGKVWGQVPSPALGAPGGILSGVAAVSP